MTEYWLQKRTLGGWSMVTWYSDKAQAEINYIKCITNIGYSWRLVKVETLQQDLLDEHTDVPAPELEQPMAKANVWAGQSSGWGEPKPVSNGWGDIPSSSQAEHGMVGKVWMVHHLLKQKKRVNPDEVEKYLANGFERGGPKTVFK